MTGVGLPSAKQRTSRFWPTVASTYRGSIFTDGALGTKPINISRLISFHCHHFFDFLPFFQTTFSIGFIVCGWVQFYFHLITMVCAVFSIKIPNESLTVSSYLKNNLKRKKTKQDKTENSKTIYGICHSGCETASKLIHFWSFYGRYCVDAVGGDIRGRDDIPVAEWTSITKAVNHA